MKRHLALGAAVLALSTQPVLAEDWTGFYLGAGVGNLEVDPSAVGVKADDLSYGVHGGYRYDTGQFVFGGELEHDWTDIEVLAGAVTVDRVFRVKATGGYDFGPALVYLAAGAAHADLDGLGDDWGSFYGIGAAYALNERTILGLELLEHTFSDFEGSGIDADAWSIKATASWKF